MKRNNGIIAIDDNFKKICIDSIELVKYARNLVIKKVNIIHLMTYYTIGMWIVEEYQKGENRAEYGKKLLNVLSNELTREFGKGYSVDTLENCRRFYIAYKDRISEPMVRKSMIEKSETAVRELIENPPFSLDWSHYLILSRIENDNERSFYEIESKNENWSKRDLQRQYNSSLYEILALSKDKTGLMKLANEGNVIEKPEDIIKQPTVLEFLGLEEKEHFVESDLESAILDKLQKFLLEMGKGYLFEKRQKRFTFDEDNYYVDLVLYNRLLKCYVLVDLKIGKINHQDLGQMQMYVNYFDRYEKKDFENPTIGILLCQEKNDSLIELTLPENANIYASEYKLYLPDKKELQDKLKEWVSEIENNGDVK